MRLALLLAAVACACATTGAPRGPRRVDPGALLDPAGSDFDVMMRQRVTVTLPDREFHFDAVLQKRGRELTLLGLTPFGTRAFVIQQAGLEVTFTPAQRMELPFPPRYMMLDVQRAFFREGGPPPAADGARELTRDGEVLRETWLGGRVMRRVYRRASGEPPGEVEVEYEGGMRGRVAPRVVRYRNGFVGYSLTIVTLEQQRLDAAAQGTR
ncbi:MAG: DUF3261 domain-containing protein [Polyangiales bacterium]